MNSVSCIIPAYNEERRINDILSLLTPLLGSLLHEIIVVDDGSIDSTKDIIRKHTKVKLIRNKTNKGKSYSIARGMRNANGKYIIMLDADLIGLSEVDVYNLITPVLSGICDITISSRGNTPRWWINIFKIETLSGERCFRKEFIIHELNTMKELSGYGLEVYINQLIISNKHRIKSVPMPDVLIDFKWTKVGLLKGVYWEFLMWKDIFSTYSLLTIIKQIISWYCIHIFNFRFSTSI